MKFPKSSVIVLALVWGTACAFVIAQDSALMEEWRLDLAESQRSLDELKASRLKSESISDLAALEEIRAEVSKEGEELDRALDGLGAAGPEEELCFAVVRGDLEKVEQLLEKGVTPDARDRYGGSALESAAQAGFTEIVQLLIEKGADVNSRGQLGGTPLIVAATQGRVESVRLLLKAGADVKAKAETGLTALAAARNNGHKEAAHLLKEAGAKE